MTDADTVSPSTHLVLFLCVALCIAFGAWAYVGQLDVVSMAQGEVIPSSQVKIVQHLEGGIVRKLLVKEGEIVAKNQPLVELESTSSGADVGELEINLTSLRVEIARLDAEATRKPKPVFDKDLVSGHPDLVRQAMGLFNTRKKLMGSQINSQKETIIQRQQDIREISTRIKNQRDSLTLQEEQVAISVELLKEDLTNRYNHLDLLKEATRLKGRIEEDKAALLGARSGLKEARSKLESIRGTFEEEVRKQLETKRRTFNELTQRLRKFADSLLRTVVRSPVDGVVKTLYVVTVGGVVRPGSNIADIVPVGDRLIIEAKLPTQDIGFVSVGQAAKIRLASSDAIRFGAIEGKVTTVSPDTLITPEGAPYYKVRIETDQDHFQRGDITYRLFPGMQVSASIITGKRAVYEYLLGPFMTSMSNAMQER